MDIIAALSKEYSLLPHHIKNVVELLDDGKTVPYIARYRKELTGSMDDQTIRSIAERIEKLRNLEKRRQELMKTLGEQGVLTDALRTEILCAESLTALEDIYRPYRQKKKTRALAAAERGLAPLADMIMSSKGSEGSVESWALRFVSPERGVASIEEALQGARDIIAEKISDDAECRSKLRKAFISSSKVAVSSVTDEDSAYSMYYEYSEPVSSIPDHRILAINRGEREGFLKVKLQMDGAMAVSFLHRAFVRQGNSTAAEQVRTAADDAWKRLIEPSLERDVRSMLTERASSAAIDIFGKNLHQLLMQPPVKGQTTLGVDPGFRTGCKLAVVDANGKVLQTGVAYFTLPGDNRKQEARQILSDMIRKYNVTAIAIGNGTASRESEAFVAEILKSIPEDVRYAIVSEAGASVYSASKLGVEEFPQYDVSLRSAISIARRLQDPLAELVKIDPKSIGVGQYQHDLKESELNKKLGWVVEECVNAVGVELSTASAALLEYVAGIGPALAKNIVAYREENGFATRAELKKVPKLGPKAFEQSAGFLRLAGSENPLDATAIHPESYRATERLIQYLGFDLTALKDGASDKIKQKAEGIGVAKLAQVLEIGEPTLRDILDELVKPGRDPRDDLPPTVLRSDVLEMNDLQKGMKLKGTIRNVIDFGVFVDIGVHQDGLVHISRMARKFIKHPSEIAKIGDVVDVWVIDVDKAKKRIALSMIEDE